MYRWLTLGWALFIVAVCSIPGSEMPDFALFSYDKLGHFGVFAILGGLAYLGWPERIGWVLTAGVAFSWLTELYQGLMPIGRFADPYDALADMAGFFVGWLALRWYGRRKA